MRAWPRDEWPPSRAERIANRCFVVFIYVAVIALFGVIIFLRPL